MTKFNKVGMILQLILLVIVVLFKLNVWWLWLGLSPIVIGMLAVYTPIRFLRRFYYEYHLRDYFASKANGILNYPMLIWFTFVGKDIFINEGYKALQLAALEEVESIANNIKNTMSGKYRPTYNEYLDYDEEEFIDNIQNKK